jgi:hypothetical protein
MKEVLMRTCMTVVLTAVLCGFTQWVEPVNAAPISLSNPDDTLPRPQLPAESATVQEYFGRKVAQLFDQPAMLVMGAYQPIGGIVPSVVRGEYTISLFTSGFNGTPAPSAVIDGSSIMVDLSSLYLSHAWRDEFRIWQIGGLATGTINLETLEFHLNWDRVFRDKHQNKVVTFALRGMMVPVPIADTATLFAAGLAGLFGVWRLKGMDAAAGSTSVFSSVATS